jgi:transposase-like protein
MISDTTTHARNGRQQANPTSADRPDPQVLARPTRRRFTAEYKRRILKEADACARHGQLGELLRREGLYSSTLSKFRHQLQTGRLDGPGPDARGAKRKEEEAARHKDARRLARLEAENQKLRALIELQKKLSELIGVPLLTETCE